MVPTTVTSSSTEVQRLPGLALRGGFIKTPDSSRPCAAECAGLDMYEDIIVRDAHLMIETTRIRIRTMI